VGMGCMGVLCVVFVFGSLTSCVLDRCGYLVKCVFCMWVVFIFWCGLVGVCRVC
jgi:hypothetical protein